MRFEQSSIHDLDMIFNLYDEAVAYQKTKFDKHWLDFDREMVKAEIAEGRQWKIMEGEEVACIFALTYSDPFIWKEKNDEPAVYIHRIVTAPQYRGKGIVKHIAEWAKAHAKENEKQYVRMDTWGDNDALIQYYQRCGFTYLGSITPTASNHLPKHYSAIYLSLFQITV